MTSPSQKPSTPANRRAPSTGRKAAGDGPKSRWVVKLGRILCAAHHVATEVSAGWHAGFLCIRRAEKFEAYGFRWNLGVSFWLHDDLPEARVQLFRWCHAPPAPADPKGAHRFADALRLRLRKAGYHIELLRGDGFEDGTPSSDWFAAKDLKTLDALRQERRRLTKLTFTPRQ